MAKPSDPNGPLPNPVARTEKAVPRGNAGHAVLRSGHQKAREQDSENAAYPVRRAVRRQPARTDVGPDPC
jgi:hypothetical protein